MCSYLVFGFPPNIAIDMMDVFWSEEILSQLTAEEEIAEGRGDGVTAIMASLLSRAALATEKLSLRSTKKVININLFLTFQMLR